MAITLMKNGRCTHSTAAIVSVVDELLGLRSLDGANACAGTAVDAFISVDDELAIFFCNCIGRAFAFAGTASDAIIGNDISHCFHLQVFPGAVNMTSAPVFIIIVSDFLVLSIPKRKISYIF